MQPTESLAQPGPFALLAFVAKAKHPWEGSTALLAFMQTDYIPGTERPTLGLGVRRNSWTGLCRQAEALPVESLAYAGSVKRAMASRRLAA